MAVSPSREVLRAFDIRPSTGRTFRSSDMHLRVSEFQRREIDEQKSEHAVCCACQCACQCACHVFVLEEMNGEAKQLVEPGRGAVGDVRTSRGRPARTSSEVSTSSKETLSFNGVFSNSLNDCRSSVSQILVRLAGVESQLQELKKILGESKSQQQESLDRRLFAFRPHRDSFGNCYSSQFGENGLLYLSLKLYMPSSSRKDIISLFAKRAKWLSALMSCSKKSL